MKLGVWIAAYLSIWSILPRCGSGGQILKVGGETGWTQFNIFSGQTPDYAAWASKLVLVPGDDLVFVFFPQLHDIHMFRSHSEYMNCNFTDSTLLDDGIAGIYTWTAPAPGTYYFGCSKDYNSHCELGQKFAIKVSDQDPSKIHLPPVGSPAAAKSPSSGGGNGCAAADESDDDDLDDSSCSTAAPSASGSSDNVLAPLGSRHLPDPSVNPRRVPDFGFFSQPPSRPSASALNSPTNSIIVAAGLGLVLVLAGQ